MQDISNMETEDGFRVVTKRRNPFGGFGEEPARQLKMLAIGNDTPFGEASPVLQLPDAGFGAACHRSPHGKAPMVGETLGMGSRSALLRSSRGCPIPHAGARPASCMTCAWMCKEMDVVCAKSQYHRRSTRSPCETGHLSNGVSQHLPPPPPHRTPSAAVDAGRARMEPAASAAGKASRDRKHRPQDGQLLGVLPPG